MDWTTLVTAALSFLGGGVGGNLINRKSSKEKANADAKGSEINVLVDAFKMVSTVTVQMKELIEEHAIVYKKKNDVITSQEEVILEMRSELRKIRYIQTEHERIMTGLQKQHTKEKSLKTFAEKSICFVEECPVRKPLLGTYRSDYYAMDAKDIEYLKNNAKNCPDGEKKS